MSGDKMSLIEPLIVSTRPVSMYTNRSISLVWPGSINTKGSLSLLRPGSINTNSSLSLLWSESIDTNRSHSIHRPGRITTNRSLSIPAREYIDNQILPRSTMKNKSLSVWQPRTEKKPTEFSLLVIEYKKIINTIQRF